MQRFLWRLGFFCWVLTPILVHCDWFVGSGLIAGLFSWLYLLLPFGRIPLLLVLPFLGPRDMCGKRLSRCIPGFLL